MKKASLCLVLLCCLGFFCPLPAQSPAADSAKKSDSNAFDAKSVYLELFKSGKLFDKREYKTVRPSARRSSRPTASISRKGWERTPRR